ncbi:MAG: hypothetical protein EZS28_033245 [Streblomastix strix]|uniref:Tyr recombinase domain-containing protein n=1 Tax=Streblomastix strix TaxID=222440 RepID=A0A5J4ULC8_9EUKA|nr:MAG: hypothetical protein EZS28_033245 [Streblomastix strix]
MERSDGYGKQYEDVRFVNSYIKSNSWCSGYGMGSDTGGSGGGQGVRAKSWREELDMELAVIILMRYSNGVVETKINEKLLPEGITIIVNTDYVVTKWNIRKWRAKRPKLQSVGRIRSLVMDMDVYLLTQHIPGLENLLVHQLSKMQLKSDSQIQQKNEQTIAKVLQLVPRQRNIQSYCIEHELVQPKSLSTSTRQLDSQSTGESREGQGTSDRCCTGFEGSGLIMSIERDDSGGGGSVANREESGEESSDDGSESVCPTIQDESGKSHKRAVEEELFRRIAGRVGLDLDVVNNVIEKYGFGRSIQVETDCNIEQCSDMEGERKGCKGALEEMMKLKTLKGVALNLFSDMRDVPYSPMVQAIVKRLNLERISKAKYPTVWNINQPLICNANSEMELGRLLKRKAITLLVAFSVARMIELAAIYWRDIVDSGEEITVYTTINKCKKPRTRMVILRTREGPCRSMGAMRE